MLLASFHSDIPDSTRALSQSHSGATRRRSADYILVAVVALLLGGAPLPAEQPFKTPVSFEDADRRAGDLLARMTIEERLELISGYRSFFIRGFPHLGIPEIYLSDATQGVHLRKNLSNQLERSTAFPCPISLAATWSPDLAYRYARSVGEECRAGGVGVLLGPGMNFYRISQCGRNFEYFGEDPYLVARLIERYVRGVLDTGTIPTLKHFVGNETEYYRRATNSAIDERTLHEIYLPGFKAGIDAGAMAVMTAYNQFNDEWCGQNHELITNILRNQLGFKWLVMTDWLAVWDARKVIRSGLDLEMPGHNGVLAADAGRLVRTGQVSVGQIDRMARSILRTCIAMGLHDRPAREESYLTRFPEHLECALQTAREGIVLLKNDGVLPLRKDASGRILLTGLFVDTLARGGGSANVEGYDILHLMPALQAVFGERIEFVNTPTDEQLRSAAVVLVSTGTRDTEGVDRPFALPLEEEQRVTRAVSLNPRTIVIVNSGGGIDMTGWNDRAAAILYAWYPGQIGNRAVAEIISGDTNPSGKLPITIERRFEDSPGFGYMSAGDEFYTPSREHGERTHPIRRIEYHEGIFVGYRWYDAKKITPLYAFGHGLSYASFDYTDIELVTASKSGDHIMVSVTVTNTAKVAGSEIAQLYVHPVTASVPRPEKELKGFQRVRLAPGESRRVSFALTTREFSYWDEAGHLWKADRGNYEVWIGGASNRIALKTRYHLLAGRSAE